MQPIRLTIYGEPVSKANSRAIVTIAGKPSSVKSKKALKFEADALRQIPPALRLRLQGPLAMTLHCYYASERPDLDESLVLDVLQDRWTRTKSSNPIVPGRRVLVQAGLYLNDRQVRERHVYHHIDRKNPRVEVEVRSIASNEELFEPEAPLPPPKGRRD